MTNTEKNTKEIKTNVDLLSETAKTTLLEKTFFMFRHPKEVEELLEGLHYMLISIISDDYEPNVRDKIVWTYLSLRDLIKESQEIIQES